MAGLCSLPISTRGWPFCADSSLNTTALDNLPCTLRLLQADLRSSLAPAPDFVSAFTGPPPPEQFKYLPLGSTADLFLVKSTQGPRTHAVPFVQRPPVNAVGLRPFSRRLVPTAAWYPFWASFAQHEEKGDPIWRNAPMATTAAKRVPLGRMVPLAG